jgi:hypothetical protein
MSPLLLSREKAARESENPALNKDVGVILAFSPRLKTTH